MDDCWVWGRLFVLSVVTDSIVDLSGQLKEVGVKTVRCLTIGAMLLSSIAGLLGCESSGAGGRYMNSTNYLPEFSDTPAPAPKPAAKPAPAAAPAAKPAPVASSGNVVYYPCGDSSCAVLKLERMYPSEVVVGQAFDYTIVATNVAGFPIDNVVIDELVPQGFRMTGSQPAGAANGSMMSFDLGRLNPNESKSIKVSGTAGDIARIVSCATASYTIPICQEIAVVKPALAITKSAPAEAMVCDTIPVKIVVSNTGTGRTRNVKVTDNLPAGLTTTDGKSSYTMDVGELAPGQSREMTFNAKVTKTGSYANTATATADGGMTASSNTTTTVFKAPVLTIKAECGGNILLGRAATFKFTVCNTGDATCADTKVTVNIPAGATFTSADNGGAASGSNVVWNIGALAPGACKTVSYVARAGGAGALTATATATCTCAAAVTGTCTINVTGTPDIGTLLDDQDGVVLVGDPHVYRYEVQNQGQVDLTNTKVVITLPEGVEFVSSNAPKAPAISGRTLTFTGVAGVLKPGDRPSFTMTVKSTTPGEKLIISETTTDQIKTPIRDDELTVFVER